MSMLIRIVLADDHPVVRDGLVAGQMLREMEVTAAMPKVMPWGS